ncbi:ParA family protein [Mycoplasmoides alvi]|uniref:ParA family protein n=1 Tax=Mycoplasmoides alvi TaxID=78580 RepID=UPI00051BF2EA|nr:ParA family protein [Mycoplasmoides alvi]
MIISFVNNKGGVLKTTLSTNIAGAFLKIKANSRVIIVDLDGQGNVSATFGQHPERLTNTIINVLKKEISVDDSIINTQCIGLDILPCNHELSFVDLDVANGDYKASDIKEVLMELEKKYDYVLVDTPPAMSTIVSVAMSVSKLIVIPFEPDQYSMLGLMRIVETMEKFRKKNPKLSAIVVPTKFSTRTRLHNDVLSLVQNKLKNKDVNVTKQYISYTTKSASAVGYERLPIILLSQKNKYQDEYLAVAKEILNKLNN